MTGSGNNRDLPIGDLLAQLQDSGARKAWSEFLERYSDNIFQVALQYAPDPDRAGDCYLYVCEKLCENNAARLQRFDPSRGAAFRSWLTAIVNNLCIDWHRSLHGRRTLPSGIRSLPELEQQTYRYRVQQSLDLETCLLLLRHQFPDLSRERLSRALSEVQNAIPPKARWRQSVLARRMPLDALNPGTGIEPADSNDGPERLAQQEQRNEALSAAMSRLTPRQRLLLRLRYEQELRLDEIARVAGLSNLHQARRLILAALRDLQEQLRARGISV